ncbi:MAG: aminotransferase class V-fold PLP-dependent enzyme [Thermoguttaceae bacterium]|nr:aminotransferase class V-fold PLP-dependent enzyme [Thermoguttaceae bacterium]
MAEHDRFIYLDNNATTAIAPEVVDAMRPYLETKYWNPSSMYAPALALAREIGAARELIASRLGAAYPDEIVFTSCATESNNAALVGGLRAALKADPRRRQIVTTRVEHPAVLEVCKQLEKDGYEVSWIGVDRDGKLNLREYVQALQPGKTAVVSIMHANNETGVVFPIEKLARLAKQTDPKIVFHVDATQSVTKLPINLSAVENADGMTGAFGLVDMLSFSGHKIHAPKGVGVLYIKRGTPFEHFLIGGHQEKGRRAGTENVPYIMGLAKALDLEADSIVERGERMAKMRDRLQNALETRVPYLVVNGKNAPRTPNTLNVAVYGAEGEAILMLMSERGVCVSSGSACTSGSLEPSHVLSAMQVPTGALQGNFRFSLSRYTTDEDIDRAIEAFVEVVAAVRCTSCKWDNDKAEPID